jgi:hypothetical protein
MPFARDGLETLRARPRQLFRLARLTRIYMRGKLLAGGIALFARRFKTHIRIDSERKTFFLAAKAILQAPPLPARRADF